MPIVIIRLLAIVSCLLAISCERKPTVQAAQAPPSLDLVTHIVVEQLGKNISEVRPDSTFAALGADDLDFVEIVMATEEALDVSIADESINEAAGVKEPQQAVTQLTIAKFAALADASPKQKRQESNEPQDGSLRVTQVGAFSELSKLPNPRGHQLVFVPSLEVVTAVAEQRSGRRLTEAEAHDLKAKSAVIAMPPADAAKLKGKRTNRKETGR